jgi:hypothetical protein
MKKLLIIASVGLLVASIGFAGTVTGNDKDNTSQHQRHHVDVSKNMITSTNTIADSSGKTSHHKKHHMKESESATSNVDQ